MSDQIEMLVMSWVIITKTESGLILGIYSATRFFSTIFAPFIGGLIDNFNKILIGPSGRVVQTFGSLTRPTSGAITREIEKYLQLELSDQVSG